MKDRRAFLTGFAFGFGFWVVAISWIPATVATFGSLPGWLSVVALGLLAAYLALFPALFAGFGAYWMGAGRGAVVVLPALWVISEIARGFVFTGFPWNLAAYSAVGVPGVLQTSAWVGAYGISALIVAVNVAVAGAALGRGWRPAVWLTLTAASLFAVGARAGLESVETERGHPVAVLQPNIDNLVSWDAAKVEDNYRKVLTQSAEVCEPGTLLVWPESAAWPFTFERHPRFRRDVEALAERGCSVLLNSPFKVPAQSESDEAKYFNAALLIESGGDHRSVERYDKQHLVPFGEYVPLGRWLPFLKRLARAAGDFSPGETDRNLTWLDESLGVSICFEVTFPGSVAGKVGRGATVLATVTNDAWYGDTWAPWQHLRAAQFRAAENHRPLVRAAITGISAIVEPNGSIRTMLGVGEEGTIEATIVGSTARTLYSRAPWFVPTFSFAVLAFAIFRRVTRPS